MRATESGRRSSRRPAPQTQPGAAWDPRVRRSRRDARTETAAVRRLLTGTVVFLLTGPVLWAAPAGAAGSHDQGPRAFPPKHQAHQARTPAHDARARVAQSQAEPPQASKDLEAASVRAGQACEAYNAARWELQRATQELPRARAAARGAGVPLARQRDRLAALIAATYQQG